MKNILKIAVISAGMFACEKVVDVDVPFEQPKLVMNAILNPDSIFSVHISKSQYILDNAPLVDITDAQLWIYGEGELLGQPQHKENGTYVLEGVKPEVGKTYTIRAEREGMNRVEGMDRVLPSVSVTNAKTDTIGEEYYRVDLGFEFEIQDPSTTENFYLMYVFIEEYGYYDQNKQEWVEDYVYWRSQDLESSDPSLEESCFRNCGFLLKDDFFNGKNYKVKFNGEFYPNRFTGPDGEEIEKERGIYLALFNISESAYLYLKTLQQNSDSSGDPFAEPAKVFTNIEGGYGALTAMSPVYVKLNP